MVNVVISLVRTGDTFSRFYQVLKNACYIGPSFQTALGDCLADNQQTTGTGAGPFNNTINGDTPSPGDTYSVQVVVSSSFPWRGIITFDGVEVARSEFLHNTNQLVFTVPSPDDNKFQGPLSTVGV